MLATDREPGPDDLSEAEQGLIDFIAGGKIAWTSVADLLAAGHTAETLEALEAAGWVVRWLDTEAVTFSAWGAWALGLVLEEHWTLTTEVQVQVQDRGPGQRPMRSSVRVATEVARWARAVFDRRGRLVNHHHPIKMPWLSSQMGLIPAPERVVSRAPSPLDEAIQREEYLMELAKKPDGTLDADPVTGKVKLRRVLLFAGAGGGVPVKLDPRLGKAKNRNRKSPRTQARSRKTG